MPRFVLLRHDCPPSFGKPSHWDLMLQRDGVLMTWSLAELPPAWQGSSDGATAPIMATRLLDHRLAYLEYEGPVSGDRGEVRRYDAGEYDLVEQSDALYRATIRGALVGGTFCLRQVNGDRWQLHVKA